MGYKQPRFMHIPDTMAKGIRLSQLTDKELDTGIINI